MLPPKREKVIIKVDACLSGFGAIMDDRAYAMGLPSWFIDMGFNINCLEGLNLLVALRTWLPELEHKDVEGSFHR